MAYFDIRGKVAIVTGGAAGMGFQYVLDLLRKGAKGVTLADIDADLGTKALQEIESEFGNDKAIFVNTDISNYDQFEDTFKKTISKFGNIDILINNAGICHDAAWRREIEVNLHGTIHGMLLGLEQYIPKHKSGSEGLIVNILSTTCVAPFGFVPIYSGTKYAGHGMTLSWGLPSHYNRTKVRVVGVCPGITITPLLRDVAHKGLGPFYEEIRDGELAKDPVQRADQMSPHVMTVIEKAPPGTIWVVEGGEAAYQYQMPDRFNMQKVYLQ